MPSHGLHNTWALRYGVPFWISDLVNKLIDCVQAHDPEERKRCHDLGLTKNRKLNIGWISIPLGKDVTAVELYEELRRLFAGSDFLHAVRAALLHHFLDMIERQIRELGEKVARNASELVVDRAYEKMFEHGLDVLSRGELEAIYSFLKRYSEEVVSDVINDVESRGKAIDSFGPTSLIVLFREYIERHGYGSFIWIHPMTRPLPLAAAVRKIHSMLSKREEVCIQFSFRYNYYYPSTPSYCFKDMSELISFLNT